MPDLPKIRVREITFSILPTATRFPFRYGIAAMTEAPHLFVHSELEIDGRPAEEGEEGVRRIFLQYSRFSLQ